MEKNAQVVVIMLLQMQIVVHTTERISHFRNTSSFELPDGWIVEEKPRKNIHYKGVIDRVLCSVLIECKHISDAAVEMILGLILIC